ncbi:MAG: DUF6056 family protein, partial [Ornithinimicrobium sp.]
MIPAQQSAHGAPNMQAANVRRRQDDVGAPLGSLPPVGARAGFSGFLVGLIVVLLLYGYWWSMLRWLIFQNDDIGHGANYSSEGSFGVSSWLQSWWRDYTIRNGRSADVVVRLLVAPGIDVARLLVPLVLTAACAAAWRFIEPSRPRFVYGVWLASAALLLPTIVALSPEVAGSTVLWTAGVANYVVPTATAIYAASWFFRPPENGVATSLAIVSIMAANLLHEQSSVAVLGIAIVALLVGTGRERPVVRSLFFVSVVGFAIKVTAPGLHTRRAIISERRELEGVAVLERNVIVGAADLVNSIDILWVLLLVSLSVATFTITHTTNRQSRSARAAMIASFGLTVVLLMVTRWWNRLRGDLRSIDPVMPDQRLTGYVIA